MLNEQAQIDTCGQEFIAKLSSSLYVALIFLKLLKIWFGCNSFERDPLKSQNYFWLSNVLISSRKSRIVSRNLNFESIWS